MEYIQKFLSFVKAIYTFPFHQYDYTGQRDMPLSVISALLIYSITALIVIPLIVVTVVRIAWLHRRQHCQHTDCEGAWTDETSDGSEPGCVAGRPCCSSCAKRHAKAAVQRRADAEPRISCPSDGTHGEMQKIIEHGVIRDECSTCGSVFLEGEELRAIIKRVKNRAYSQGYSSGRSSGSSSGLATGIVIGSSIN